MGDGSLPLTSSTGITGSPMVGRSPAAWSEPTVAGTRANAPAAAVILAATGLTARCGPPADGK